MAAKKTARKARKTVTRAKASRKSTTRSARKSPKYNAASGVELPGNPIEVF
jgi:hypothetical protein